MDIFHYTLFWVCVVGICLGSFFNVVILRSLNNESIVYPPSKCPKCGHKLYFWHNIPVLSYILLGGRCYFCQESISIQYPIVELVTMICFAGVFIKFGLSWNTLFFLFWISCLIIMTATDIKEKIVDCNIAIAMSITGIIYNYINTGWHGVLFSILGFLTGFILLEIIARLGYIFVKSRAMGEADSYVAGAIGAIFGLSGLLSVLLYGLIGAMIFIIPKFLYDKLKYKEYRTFIYFSGFILLAFIYKFYIQNYVLLLLLVAAGIYSAMAILKGMEKSKNNSYLPFVPALAAGIIWGFYLM